MIGKVVVTERRKMCVGMDPVARCWIARWDNLNAKCVAAYGETSREAALYFVIKNKLAPLNGWTEHRLQANLYILTEPEPVERAALICTACNGTKKLVLFTTVEDCESCKGTGEVPLG